MFANVAGKGGGLPADNAEAVHPARPVAPGRGCICTRTSRLSARTASNASSLHCTEKENKHGLDVWAPGRRPDRGRIPRLH